ncbi:7630552f-96ab-41cf-8523-f973691513a3 [Sclerotinia trifoliorum]|uniref:7630552f-96ab-41cf-8523-f973691513a3 n=1 Tax=Sclerotinia trifoliorum TaxID=28548 RepID=A0A8H2VZ09_9HELO|nr:7630552f-96ab-41cf-8523-f973691513a3 [Sclerotinia trifoliorum]
MSDYEKLFEEAVKGIKAAKSFPYDNYTNRLHNKVRASLEYYPHLQPYIDRAPNYPPNDDDPDNMIIDIFDIWDLFVKASIPTISNGIANVDDKYDPKDLKQYVSGENAEVRYLEVLTNLMGFCLGEHINRELESQQAPNMEILWNDLGFSENYMSLLTSQSFINNEIRTDIIRSDHLFSIAWLMIADYMQDRNHVYRTAPTSSGIQFQDRASCQILNQWSYTLWEIEGKGNPAKMDEIVKFCGRLATIGLCPPNATTNVQRPAKTWIVTKEFYDVHMGVQAFDDGDYNTELQDSLNRLQDQEDLVNEWNSYCLALTNSWEKQILPYWNVGLHRAFLAEEFYAVTLWQQDAYSKEYNDYYGWGMDYLPVISLNEGESPRNIIFSGTSISLADGTARSIEALSPGDRVLVNNDSKFSVTAFPTPVRQSPRADLIGFNGEVPWALSSQVFHTTTGPRAVDPEAAEKLNSYRRIGKLAVGHILFRLKSNDYEAVAVRSIEKTKKCQVDSVFTLSLPGNAQTYHANSYLVDMNSESHALKETAEMLRKVPGDKRLALLSHFQELRSMFGKFDSQAIYERLNWELFGQYNSPDGQKSSFWNSKYPLNYTENIKMSKALSVSRGFPVDRLARGFRLKAHHVDQLPAGYELPDLSLVDGYLIVQGEVQIRSTYDSRKRQFRWTRELKQTNLFEHGVFEIYSRAIAGKGVIYISSEYQAQEAPPRDKVHSFEAKACSLDQLTGGNTSRSADESDDNSWESIAKWQVTMDRSVWPPDTERTEPEEPIDGGIFDDGFWNGPPTEVLSMRVTLVEQLRDQINQKFGKQLGSFYDVTSRLKGGETVFSIKFKRAPLVPFISDAGLDMKKTFGVSFKSDLDIDITLPSLFTEMNFTVDAFYESFTGYFFEYDPTKRGYKGNRHLVQGTIIESDAVTASRLKISRAYELALKSGEAQPSDGKLQPATVTESLLALSDPSLKDLITFGGYQEQSLHNDSQLLIRNMMYYHMDEDQRKDILKVPKPSVPKELPLALADNLPAELKTFFKDKYGPAFICRYVGRTQKYMSSFTDKDMKKLWYWWQGNGKNCLSQSEEYNDINRLSSREAMKGRYHDNLQPYLDSDPDNWASQLYDKITKNHALLITWVHFPIGDDGNNLINKQCNILDALSPSADWSQQFFNTFMAFALNEGASIADIEPGGDEDAKYNWLYDSMKDLIVAIINDDPSISSDVKEGIMEDINDFEKQNNLNQEADAETRAAALLEKSTLFMQELSGWFSYIGKGLQAAFSGTALWKWVGQAFDRVAEKFSSSLPGVSKLKGLSSICMVGVSLAIAAVSLWGLVNNWDILSDDKRAVIIIEVVRMVVSGVDKALDAFKKFKSKPASTPADEVNMEALSASVSEEITEKSSEMGDLAQEISGKEDYRTAIADGIHGEGVPTEPEGEGSWNKDIGDIVPDVPPGYEDVPKKFNFSGNMLRVLNAILGVGLVVAMSFALATDWGSLSEPGKWIGVLNIIVQGLTVLLDIIDVGADIGLWAVTGTFSVALPILGAVLAVVGVILMVVQLFINLFIKAQPPPDPIANFIDDVGHELIASFDPSPESNLKYSISASDVTAGQVTTITITGKNESSGEVTITNAAITLYSGDDDVCLFRNGADDTENIILVPDTDADKNENGHTFVTPSKITSAQLPIPARLGNESIYYEYDLRAAGLPKETSGSLNNLILQAGESFQSIWTARINNRGDDKEKSTSWIEIVENGLTDACQSQFVLQRN